MTAVASPGYPGGEIPQPVINTSVDRLIRVEDVKDRNCKMS